MDMEQNGEQTGSDLSQSTAKPASYKRIIICADGTWLSSSDGDKAVPSNVAKIARAISPDGLDDDNNLVKQIVYYHSGLGTGDLPLQKAIYGETTPLLVDTSQSLTVVHRRRPWLGPRQRCHSDVRLYC